MPLCTCQHTKGGNYTFRLRTSNRLVSEDDSRRRMRRLYWSWAGWRTLLCFYNDYELFLLFIFPIDSTSISCRHRFSNINRVLAISIMTCNCNDFLVKNGKNDYHEKPIKTRNFRTVFISIVCTPFGRNFEPNLFGRQFLPFLRDIVSETKLHLRPTDRPYLFCSS